MMQVNACHRCVSWLEGKDLGQGAYEGARGPVKMATLDRGFRKWRTRSLAPDDAFLIEEVIDHFDTITHLDLRLFGHREDGSEQLA
jgi:hypothetical protein